ncbi:MAG: DUF2461 domain-containing protein [Nocardioidaceae bacterium]
MAEFDGFSTAALDFYEDLENDNSKAFWTANKEIYDREVKTPMLALVDTLSAEFGKGKVFRPYRDVRFSKDKTPYKTHQGAYVATAPAAGYYVQIDAPGLLVGAGWYDATAERKGLFRSAVDTDPAGAELLAILADAEESGFEVGGDRVKTAPRGWSVEHPRIELLRHNTLSLTRRYVSPSWLDTSETLERVRTDWRAVTPLLDWLRHYC